MLNKLQQRWKASAWQVVLILCTFALGGSLSGYLGRLILNALPILSSTAKVAFYIIIVTLLWPALVLAVSLLFGQFRFFKKYLKRIAVRLRIMRPEKINN